MREYIVPEISYEKSGKKCVSIFVPCTNLPKKSQKMREYFVPENIRQKSLHEMRTYFLSVQISSEISGKKCVRIFTNHKTN